MIDLSIRSATRALALYNEQRDVEAMRLIDHALGLDPKCIFARYLKGVIAIAQGDFVTGLPLQELRYQCPGTQAYAARYKPRRQWDGRPTRERVLLWGEQGYGDMIQMLRFVPIVWALCPNVMFEIDQLLLGLARQVYPATVPAGDEYPDFDCHCSLTSLPYLLGIRPETIGGSPYLKAQPTPNAYGLKIGICWSRNTDTPTRHHRNMSADDVAPLADEFDLLSLQHENNTWHTFAETASLLAGLDLVITVDSALAHLAGALGIPVWVMLSVNCDQRWMRRRLDTPWYRSMRLFRQEQQGDWRSVVRDIASELRKEEHAKQPFAVAPRQGAAPGRDLGADLGAIPSMVGADQA